MFRSLILMFRSRTSHCVKSVHIRSYSGSCFPVFGLSRERSGVSLRIQAECGKIWTRITPNADTFHAVSNVKVNLLHERAPRMIHSDQTSSFEERFAKDNSFILIFSHLALKCAKLAIV